MNLARNLILFKGVSVTFVYFFVSKKLLYPFLFTLNSNRV